MALTRSVSNKTAPESLDLILPTEILEFVFIWGLVLSKTEPGYIPYLLTITSVSSRWRTIAIAKGDLWTLITISLRREKFKTSLDCLNTFLKRSKSALLQLRLSIYWPMDPRDNSVSSVVVPHLSRCRSIMLDFGNSRNWRQFLPFSARMDSLRKLSIRELRLRSGRNSTIQLIAGGSVSPPLKKLRLYGDVMWDLSTIDTALIRVIDIPKWQDWSSFVSFLSRCADLDSMWLVRDAIPDPDTVQPTILRHLRSLHIDASILAKFFRSVSTPGLEELFVTGKYSSRSRHPPIPSIDWATIMRPSTRTLGLEDLSLSGSCISPLFKSAAAVWTLNVRGCNAPEAVLDTLVGCTQPSVCVSPSDLLPNLETLIVSGSSKTYCDTACAREPLEQLLKARPNLFVELNHDVFRFSESIMSIPEDETAGIEELKTMFGERFNLSDGS